MKNPTCVDVGYLVPTVAFITIPVSNSLFEIEGVSVFYFLWQNLLVNLPLSMFISCVLSMQNFKQYLVALAV